MTEHLVFTGWEYVWLRQGSDDLRSSENSAQIEEFEQESHDLTCFKGS